LYRYSAAELEVQIAAESAAATVVESAEASINTALANRLAEVYDGHGSAAAAEGFLDAMATSEAGSFSSVAVMSKSERQQELELAYYGPDYIGEGPMSGRELALLCYSKVWLPWLNLTH
jgi:hypothetical protein